MVNEYVMNQGGNIWGANGSSYLRNIEQNFVTADHALNLLLLNLINTLGSGVAQLAKQFLPIPEDLSLNTVFGNFY